MQEMLNKIILGDCLDVMKGMPDKCVDLVLTDIPYNEVNRKSSGLRNLNKGNADILTFNLTDFIKDIIRITKGSGYIFCGREQISDIYKILTKTDANVRLGFWEKTNPSPMNGQYTYLSGIESFVFFKFPKATFNEHCRNAVFRCANGSSKIHPTEKPIKLFQEMVKISSNINEIVFDPCIGSGTTAIAAIRTGRQFIGIEKDPEYHRLACERVEKEKLNLFNTGGKNE